MANQTITVDTDIATVIAAGLLDGQNITINNGARLTVDQSPTVVIGQVTVNAASEYLWDGENAANPIVMAGEEAEEINVNGAGLLRVTSGWWEFPTTGDGAADQTFDASTYWNGGVIDNDVFSGVWVETGRRINYDAGVGVPPLVGDWVFAVLDNDIHGRITEVSGDGVTGYIVVRFLTGAVADNDAIELHTLQDNNGPDHQKSWTANANGADVREPGTFQGFGNAHQNNTNFLTSMGSGMAGFGFAQAWQSQILTFGDGINGFIVPNGAIVRVPMVHAATATIASAAANNPTWPTISNRYEIETANGGDIDLAGLSLGSAQFEDTLCGSWAARYCAANTSFGGWASVARTSYDDCIFVPSINDDTRGAARGMPAIADLVSGADVRDCIGVSMNDVVNTVELGAQTSLAINYERVIQVSNGTALEAEFTRTGNITIHDIVVIGTQLVFTTCAGVKMTLLKTQRNLDGSVGGSDQVVTQANTSGFRLTGWETLQGSCPDDSKIVIADTTDIRVYGHHFYDDKFDNEGQPGTQGEEFANVSGLSADIVIARCYQDRGSPNEFIFQVPGTTKNLIVMNCSGEYNGEIDPDGIDISYRGLHGGSGSLGASTGLETDYPGTIGAHMGDNFRSDTTGYIYYRNVPGSDDYPTTILSGNPIFTKDGDVDYVLGDQWEVDMGYFARGHISFTGILTTTRGGSTAANGIQLWTLADIDFQYDLGSGYNGVWLDLRTSANLTGIAGMVGGIRLKLRFTGTGTDTNAQALTIHTTTTIAAQQANLHSIAETVNVMVTVTDEQSGLPLEDARVYLEAGAIGPMTPGAVILGPALTNASGIVQVDIAISADQSYAGMIAEPVAPGIFVPKPVTGMISAISGAALNVSLVGDE